MSLYNHFLLIGLKISLLYFEHPEGFITFSDVFPVTDDITYSVVLTKESNKDDFAYGMILISSEKPLSLREGMHYGHAVECLLPISYFCIARLCDDLSILPLHQDTFKKLEKPWKSNDIFDDCNHEIIDLYGHLEHFRMRYNSYNVEGLEWLENIAPYLRKYIKDADFQRGCSYLFLSMWELGIDVCDWADEDYDQDFYRFVSISKAESAFLNAFKTIEAIVGEPSKNRTRQKLTQKLQAKGINLDENVGYKHKSNVIDKVLEYHPLRDQIAAHGIGKIKRELKLSEIIELQSLARYLLLGVQ
jgi:hypothetical protein